MSESSTGTVRLQIVTVDIKVGIRTQPFHQVTSAVRRECWRDDVVFLEYRIDIVVIENGFNLVVRNALVSQLLTDSAVFRWDMSTREDRPLMSRWIEDGSVPLKRRCGPLGELGVLVLT